ncbi:hypothetical protein GCM10022267_90940 [Lentzea roselyniae]|uniref:Uncharacterized protein n=1 Tax=Lentzea roselyniae TaxID=531940 RepID=A0ABP7CJN9_9PSEU
MGVAGEVGQSAAQTADGVVDLLAHRAGRVVPERVHELVDRHDPVRVEQEDREELALAGAAEPDRLAGLKHFERPEQAKLHVHLFSILIEVALSSVYVALG